MQIMSVHRCVSKSLFRRKGTPANIWQGNTIEGEVYVVASAIVDNRIVPSEDL